jgi:hypothetical protein
MAANSRLTLERPDIWQRGLDMATSLTGYLYLPKRPATDGTVFSCGYTPYVPTKDSIQSQIERQKDHIEWLKKVYPESPDIIEEAEEELLKLKRSRDSFKASVLVPEGAMEWLLHEVGHWIAASPEERKLPNYGDGHEIEAWAFEEIVLGQFGPARYFAPPTQRDGTAFDISGPIPAWAFRHIDRSIKSDRVAVEQFSLLWAEWVIWEHEEAR